MRDAQKMLDQLIKNGDRLQNFEDLIHDWAAARQLFKNANPKAQFEKTQEEVDELWQGITNQNIEEISDAIGDIIVTLIIQAHMHGLSLGECMWSAWQQIKDRTGKTINGKFVKDEEPNG